MRSLFPFFALSRGRARLTLLWVVALIVLASTSVLAESVEVNTGPSPIPYMKPGARVTVLFDGKPMPGATVNVWRHFHNDELRLETDGEGRVKLPELPAGSYSISASTERGTPQGQIVDVCMIACAENLIEVTELAFDSLQGPIYAIDRAALGISEISIEIAPDRTPGFNDAIADAEKEPAAFTLSEFSGVVLDQTGAVIPGASVAVASKREQGMKVVSAMATDGVGGFAARLDPGDYYVVVAAQGFRSRTLHVAITPQGSADKAQITLTVGSVTQVVTISEYRPWTHSGR